MDIDTLRLLTEVARAGSFAAVARARGVEPSSISRAILALEAELGARLLQRTTRAMRLTEAGERYVAEVAPLIRRLDAAREALGADDAEPSGALRVTASVAFGETLLAPLLPAFQAEFPRVTLELVLSDANLDLVSDRIDLALRLAPSYRADVIGVKLFPTRYRVVAAPAYIAATSACPAPASLTEHACVLSAVPEFRTRWLFRRGDAIDEVLVKGALVSSNAVVLRAAAVAGLGPALLADWLIRGQLASGELIDLFPEHDVTGTTFETAAWLLYVSRDHLPRKVRRAIDFFRDRLCGDIVTRVSEPAG